MIRIIDRGMKRIIKRSNPSNGQMATKLGRVLADELIDDIRANWSPESPSRRGEAPAVVTGFLDAHIRKHKVRNSVWQVTGDTDYAGVLESPAYDRPYMRPAAIRVGQRAVEILQPAVREEMGE